MGKLAEWLMLMVGPLVVRGLAAVGFTAVTFAGVDVLVKQLVANAQTSWSAMPFAVLQLATLGGLPTALGVVFGAAAGRFALKFAVGASQYIFKPK